MIDYKAIIERYTQGNQALCELLTAHSEAVRDKALEIAHKKNLNLNLIFVEEAAMLHDIGVVKVEAPSIYCYGSKPYICHGVEGRIILDNEGLHHHALVCERHTGSGISIKQIEEGNLPLPHRDMLPLSLEEKLICYADKFFSKSREPRQEKPIEKIIAQMQAHGQEAYERFMELNAIFF